MSWIDFQTVNNAGNIVKDNKIAKGNNWQLNIGQGEKAFDVLGLVASGVGAGGDFLINSGNEYLNTGDIYKDTLLKGIYGDASQGNLMLIVDNISGKSKNNALLAINDNTYRNTGILGSNLDLINSFNSINKPVELEKRGAGSIVSTIGGSIAKGAASGFATGSAIPGIGNAIGTIGGAILGLAGGIGSSINGNNYEKIKKAQELAYNNSLNNFNTQVLNTTKQNNLNSLVNMTALGGQLNYNIDNKYLANDYMSKLNNRVYKPQFDSMNYFAMGGMPDFNEFNTGGTHELNPNGGIPQGMDKLGIINTVELGETKTTTPEGDYIFSDRLKLSKEECKQLGVPKDSTYAEASKILRKEYDEMPNDDIAKRGWEQSRDMLIQSLEMLKQEIALKEARKQGLTSPKMLGINPQVMQDMYYNENPQEEDLLQQGINPNILNAFGGFVKKLEEGGPASNIYDIGSYYGESFNSPEFYNLLDLIQKSNDTRNMHFPILQAETGHEINKHLGTPVSNQLYMQYIAETAYNNVIKLQEYDKARLNTLNIVKSNSIPNSEILKSANYRNDPKDVILKERTADADINSDIFNEENLRYAPVLGNLAAAIKNTFTKPDYKYADRLDLMALRINTNISTPNNYNYMTYNPVDSQIYLNNYNAQANAARLAIMNTTNPSRNSALLAAQYNDLIGRGDLMQSIDLVNKNHYNDVIVRNNAVNAQKNADALNTANANFTRQQYLLGLMQQANALRQAEDEGLKAARAQQWSNAFDSLGALGQEALANKQVNRWFELSKLAPGLTFELYNNILDGKAELVKQDDGSYKYTEK